jgi:hypothetical protein
MVIGVLRAVVPVSFKVTPVSASLTTLEDLEKAMPFSLKLASWAA